MFILGYSDALYIVLIIVLIIDILPTIIIHCQYLLKNKGDLITIDSERKFISLISNDVNREYPFYDILSIECFLSFLRPTGWHSFGEYRYYKIIFKDNNQFIITCMLVPNIEDNLATHLPLEVKKHDRLLALISD